MVVLTVGYLESPAALREAAFALALAPLIESAAPLTFCAAILVGVDE
jgi:hypothetical protein